MATIRAPVLAASLSRLGEVQAVVTEQAKRFVRDWPEEIPLHHDEEEWREWSELGDPVIHIELRKWADVLLIAPLSANSLAKLTHGLCDNLLLSVARAWDFSKPMVLAPAMNTKMWEHPLTSRQLEMARTWGAVIVPPVAKELACADVGMGALALADDIAAAVRRSLEGVSSNPPQPSSPRPSV